MTEALRVWTRRELEEAARTDVPEGRTMLRVGISPKLLLLLMDYVSQQGERVELLSSYGDPLNCDLRFFKRDGA